MTIEKIDERRISVLSTPDSSPHAAFTAVVRNGVVVSMVTIRESYSTPTKERIEGYIVFCKEVLEAIKQTEE